jgi:uncharacterized protein YbjQ (UPF0145 family)
MVPTMPKVLVTTTETIPGFRILKVLGPVVGVAARTRSPYVEGLKSMSDGHGATPLQRRDVMVHSRFEAVNNMIEQAEMIGANAVVAMRFDHRGVTDVWNEICAYGTAVCVEMAP